MANATYRGVPGVIVYPTPIEGLYLDIDYPEHVVPQLKKGPGENVGFEGEYYVYSEKTNLFLHDRIRAQLLLALVMSKTENPPDYYIVSMPGGQHPVTISKMYDVIGGSSGAGKFVGQVDNQFPGESCDGFAVITKTGVKKHPSLFSVTIDDVLDFFERTEKDYAVAEKAIADAAKKYMSIYKVAPEALYPKVLLPTGQVLKGEVKSVSAFAGLENLDDQLED